MKKSLAYFCCAVFLASCATDDEKGVKPGEDPRRAAFGKALKGELLKGCKYVPTVNTILEILDVVTPNVSKAGKIATEICKVLEEGSKSGGLARYKGVHLQGKFVD